jgi:tRNA pseudouridine32 synthase/23S rRNA pseudouridine746 synthase
VAGRAGRRPPPSPLPQQAGVAPVRVRLPGGAEAARWATVREHLLGRYGPVIGDAQVEAMLAEGRFVTLDGPVGAATPYVPGGWVWFHRDRLAEPEVPFEVEVVYRDAHVVVADKPHFLATTPRGRHVTQTALSRLRHSLALPQLTPAHRLDRLTAGLVLFVVRPEDRGAYQNLFRDRRVRKEYEAVAVHDPAVELPRSVRSRIVKERGRMAAEERDDGPPNAETRVELLALRAGLGRYRLLPATGRTHQLRLHMAGLGLPLLNDPLYPKVLPEGAADDWSRPLQLLARALEFTDPVTGRAVRFESTRRLARWPEGGGTDS